uniref:Uncharacterized protein n=1 Tax=Parascaris univalens TaxID=6257 RepID=A0A915BRH0_PARUN
FFVQASAFPALEKDEMMDGVLLFIVFASITYEVIAMKDGNRWCPTEIIRTTECPTSNFLYYFDCCGSIKTDCCFHLQVTDNVMVSMIRSSEATSSEKPENLSRKSQFHHFNSTF